MLGAIGTAAQEPPGPPLFRALFSSSLLFIIHRLPVFVSGLA